MFLEKPYKISRDFGKKCVKRVLKGQRIDQEKGEELKFHLSSIVIWKIYIEIGILEVQLP